MIGFTAGEADHFCLGFLKQVCLEPPVECGVPDLLDTLEDLCWKVGDELLDPQVNVIHSLYSYGKPTICRSFAEKKNLDFRIYVDVKWRTDCFNPPVFGVSNKLWTSNLCTYHSGLEVMILRTTDMSTLKFSRKPCCLESCFPLFTDQFLVVGVFHQFCFSGCHPKILDFAIPGLKEKDTFL